MLQLYFYSLAYNVMVSASLYTVPWFRIYSLFNDESCFKLSRFRITNWAMNFLESTFFSNLSVYNVNRRFSKLHIFDIIRYWFCCCLARYSQSTYVLQYLLTRLNCFDARYCRSKLRKRHKAQVEMHKLCKGSLNFSQRS